MVFWASPKLQAGQTSLSILNGAIKGKMKICLIASDKKIFNKKFFCAFWTILTQKCRIFLRLLWRKMWSDWYARVPSHSKIRQFARVSDSPVNIDAVYFIDRDSAMGLALNLHVLISSWDQKLDSLRNPDPRVEPLLYSDLEIRIKVHPDLRAKAFDTLWLWNLCYDLWVAIKINLILKVVSPSNFNLSRIPCHTIISEYK